MISLAGWERPINSLNSDGCGKDVLVMNKPQLRPGFLPRWLPATIAIVIAGISFYRWQALNEQEDRHFSKAVSAQMTEVEKTLSGYVDAEIFSLVRTAKQSEYWGSSFRDVWVTDTEQYLKHHPGYHANPNSNSSSRSGQRPTEGRVIRK